MKIYGKIHEAKKEIGIVKKNAKNPHFKNTYADLNALIEAVEPILLEKGLILLQPIKDGKVYTQIIDIDNGEMVESNIELTPNLTAQALGSQITYFRRYQISSIFCLQALDDDGQLASQPQPVQLPICTSKLFEKAVERYEGLELDVFDKLKKSFTLTAQQEIEIKEITNK